MWLDLWLDEIRTLGTTLLTSASKERYATLLWLDEIETRGATTEDWWKRDLPEWVFEEAMATAQKNNLDEGTVQPSGVLPGHVLLLEERPPQVQVHHHREGGGVQKRDADFRQP